MKSAVCLMLTGLAVLMTIACSSDPENAAVMGVEFEWQAIDNGSSDNPEIRLSGVPEGTVRFLVSLVDLNMPGFDHGSGFVDNDESGIIARGATKGSYIGPAPHLSTDMHTYEITVRAYDKDGNVIGVGRKAKPFTFTDVR